MGVHRAEDVWRRNKNREATLFGQHLIRVRARMLLSTYRELKQLRQRYAKWLNPETLNFSVEVLYQPRIHDVTEEFHSLYAGELRQEIKALENKLLRLRRNYVLAKALGKESESMLKAMIPFNRDTEVKVLGAPPDDPFATLPDPDVYYVDEPESPNTDSATFEKYLLPNHRIVRVAYFEKFNRIMVRL